MHMEKPKKYKVLISKDALLDIKSTKKYILDTFKYREYAESFSRKIKKAIKELDFFSTGYEKTGYVIEGLSIYFRPYSTYLIFFCCRGHHCHSDPSTERQNVLAVRYKENAKNKQIRAGLLLSVFVCG